jgi:hypothetical protein
VSTGNRIRDLNGVLNSIRTQIQFLEASVASRPDDTELQKRLRKAKNQERLIMAKLCEQTMN